MNTKSYITQEAFKLFMDKGYRNTSLSSIVDTTKLSKGAIYHYFRNKEELYVEVINTYFLSYFNQVDFDELRMMKLKDAERKLKTFFSSFTPQTIAITEKGISRHFILFFEAFELHPTFRDEIRLFYSTLREVLEEILKNSKETDCEIKAIAMIAKYEGLLFWQSVFPEQKIDNLVMKV